ncbi:MAG: hypothetical protein K2X99_13100 [Gemmatimonadaceae bacterium]|nr:hypothetical protein [Gemmatimonadaceae bacterium]
MKKKQREIEADEPLGIIISAGSRAEETPKVWAYLWEAVPELTTGKTPTTAMAGCA